MELFDILTYDKVKVIDVPITTTDPDWTDLLSLDTPSRETGDYELMFSLQFHLNSTSQSFLYRFSHDGGATWGAEYSKEVKDRSNIEVIEVFDELEHTGGSINVAVQVSREGSADCEVKKAFIKAERKG